MCSIAHLNTYAFQKLQAVMTHEFYHLKTQLSELHICMKYNTNKFMSKQYTDKS